MIDPSVAKQRFRTLVDGGMTPENAAKAAFDEPIHATEPAPTAAELRASLPEAEPEAAAPTPKPPAKAKAIWKPRGKKAVRKAKPRPNAPKPSPELESYVRDLIESGKSPREAADHVRRMGLLPKAPPPEPRNIFAGALSALSSNLAGMGGT